MKMRYTADVSSIGRAGGLSTPRSEWEVYNGLLSDS